MSSMGTQSGAGRNGCSRMSGMNLQYNSLLVLSDRPAYGVAFRFPGSVLADSWLLGFDP